MSYQPFIAAFTALCLGFFIHTLGYIGAGDVKLYATFLLAISPVYWSFSLVLIIILGGILAGCYLLYGLITNNLVVVRAKGIPYGVAITIASVFSVWVSHF